MLSVSIIPIMLIMPILAFAQPPDSLWSRTFGGSGREHCNSIQQTSDGGYILGGETNFFGAGSWDFWVVKTDASGDCTWSRTFGGNNFDQCFSVEHTTDGGYVFGGYTWSFGAGLMDFWIVKTNANGDSLWSRTFGGSRNDICYSVQQTADGGYILGGRTESFGYGLSDFWVMKTDVNGDSVWSRTFGGIGEDDCHSVQQTADGGYIFAGCTESYGVGYYDFWLIKTDPYGTVEWHHTFGGISYDVCLSVQQTTDGGYICGGYTDSFGAGYEDFWLLRVDANGDSLWSRTFGGSGEDVCYSILKTDDDGYVLGGYTSSYGAGSKDIWLLKTDDNGMEVWSRTFGGDRNDYCSSLQRATDGGYILGGRTYSFGAGSYDFWLVKTEPEYPNVGYVTLLSPGPPDWGYRLHHVSGALSRVTFTDFCDGTIGSVRGNAASAGWTATNYTDSIVFTTTTPLTSGAIDTFCLSHPWCSDVVDWTVGDSSGSVEGPLPVEMTTFQAVAGDGQVMLQWRTESELDNDHFVLYKRKAGEENFHPLTEISGYGTTAEPHDYQYIDSWVQNGTTYDYQISDVDIAGRETFYEQIISATPSRDIVPTEFALHQNYPNPFNLVTTIRYDVKEAGLVSLKIFDLLGREVTTLTHEEHAAGSYSMTWDAAGMPSGIYLARMEAEGFAQVRKLLLVK